MSVCVEPRPQIPARVLHDGVLGAVYLEVNDYTRTLFERNDSREWSMEMVYIYKVRIAFFFLFETVSRMSRQVCNKQTLDVSTVSIAQHRRLQWQQRLSERDYPDL